MDLTPIHHVAINVSNYEASKDFYAHKLAFKTFGKILGKQEE
ncbi:MAG: VOC family protein [Lachnospiraceae bacterium]